MCIKSDKISKCLEVSRRCSMYERLRRHDTISVTILFIVINIISILRMGDSVGLYLDAVNPDYLAVKLLNHNNFTSAISLPYIGIPFLGQIYHGTVTMFGSLLAILVTGSTSVLQLRIMNGLWGALCVTSVYQILKRVGCKRQIAFAICFLLSVSPNFIGTFFTQYYIELPGIFFLLLQIYFLLTWNDSLELRRLLAAGIFGGLAIYDYFNFIFFVPSVLIFVLFLTSNKKTGRSLENIMTIISGYAMGVIPFIVGYTELVICASGSVNRAKIILVLIAVVVSFVVCIILYKLQKKVSIRNRIISFVILLICLACVLIIGLLVSNLYANYIRGLNVQVSEGLLAGVSCIIRYLGETLCHSTLEYLVIGKYSSVGMIFIPTLTFVLSVVSFYIVKFKKYKNADNRLNFLACVYFATAVYLICCIPLATRMQGQHFICMLFLMYIALGLGVSIVTDYLAMLQTGTEWKNVERTIYAVVLFILVFNQTTVAFQMRNNNGVDSYYNKYYSNAVQKLSENANSNREEGKKEYYIFPEWGILCGFDYLTGNGVDFTGSIDPDALRWLNKDCGYDVIVCYWDEGNENIYKSELLKVFGKDEITMDSVRGNYGNILEMKVMK